MKILQAVTYSLLGALLAVIVFLTFFEMALYWSNEATQLELRAITVGSIVKFCTFVFVVSFAALLRFSLLADWQSRRK